MREISWGLSVSGKPLPGRKAGLTPAFLNQKEGARLVCQDVMDRVADSVAIARVYDQSPADTNSVIGDVDYADGVAYTRLESQRSRGAIKGDAMNTVKSFYTSSMGTEFNYSRDGQKEVFDERTPTGVSTVIRDRKLGTITLMQSLNDI